MIYALQYGSSFILLFGVLIAAGLIKVRKIDPTKLTIHYARYRRGKWPWQYRTFTKAVRGLIKNNTLDILPLTAFGDPYPNKIKVFTVKYSYGGITREIHKADGRNLALPVQDSLPSDAKSHDRPRLSGDQQKEFLTSSANYMSAEFLAHEADSLARRIEEIWHHWDAENKKLLHPLAVHAIPDQIIEWAHKELLEFCILYRYYLRIVGDELPDFKSRLLHNGFPNDDRYLDVKRNIEEHASQLRELSEVSLKQLRSFWEVVER